MNAASVRKTLTIPFPIYRKIEEKAKKERRSFNQAAMLIYEDIFLPKGVPHLKQSTKKGAAR